MPWLQVLIFLIRYGTGIVGVVKSIWELFEWLKTHDEKCPVLIGGDKKTTRTYMNNLAKSAKQRGDLGDLNGLRDMLETRRKEVRERWAKS